MNRLLSLTILLLLATGEVYAQPYYFKRYQVESGLSNNTVTCSVQDKNGFMWFGTKEGLNRFDGYHFKLFNLDFDNERTLSHDLIQSLFIDQQGLLWVGSQKGLYQFDAVHERLIRFIDRLQEIKDIQTDKYGRLWFISNLTLCRYNFNTKTLKRFLPAEYFSATSVCQSEDGTLWASTADGFLQSFDPATETFKSYNVFAHSPKPTSNWIQTIHSAGKGSLFVGTSSQGLKQFDMATATYREILTFNPDKTSVYVRDIIQYASHEFWFATESGIFILDTDTHQFTHLKKKFLNPYSLSDNAVYTLCKDTEGGVWAGTYFGGLNYYPKPYTSFQKYFPDYTKNAISGNAVREICEDDFGNLWIGTEDAGLNKLNKKTGATTHFKPTGSRSSIAYSNIHGLLADGNNLWIGTFEHGLDVLDIKTGKVKKHYIAGPGKKDLKNNFIVTLLKTSSGDIWAGTANGIYLYDKKEDGFERFAGIPDYTFVSSMIEGRDKTIWIGTQGRGVFYYNPITRQKGNFENEAGHKNGLTTNSINAVFEDSYNNLWFATEGGGLCKLNSDRNLFSNYTTQDGLPSNFIFKVLEDNKKDLWISTSKGLANLNPAHNSITNFTKANGLLTDQFNYNSGYKDAAGVLYFGCVKGMITFRPDSFLQSTFVPPVYITGFQVHNKELTVTKEGSGLKKSIVYTDEITLPHDRSSINIDFAALSYNAPEMTNYKYRMQGLDKEWTYIKSNRKVYFTNLPPGNYIFRLKAGTNGHWSAKERQLTIKILPPFWATARAYLFYAILTGAIIFYLFRLYHRIIEDKKEKEIYEAKIEFFTNVAHEIRTPLTLIKGPVENLLEQVDDIPQIKEDVTMMQRNTNRLVALVTQILDFRQTEIKGFSLDFAQVNITELLREVYVSFEPLAKKKALQYTIHLPPATIYALADDEALYKILSNLFSNAVKYAHQEIIVRLYAATEDDHDLTIEMANDGYIIPAEMKEKIFEPFYRLKETLKQKGTGIGLTLARSLTELHLGRLYLKTSSMPFNIFVLNLPLRPEQAAHTNKLKKNKSLIKTK